MQGQGQSTGGGDCAAPGHQGLSGSWKLTRAPRAGALEMSQRPPSLAMRERILERPLRFDGAAGSNPLPLSSMTMPKESCDSVTRSHNSEAAECLAALARASLTTR